MMLQDESYVLGKIKKELSGPLAAPHGPDCEDCTARQWFASCVVLFVLSLTYLYGVVCSARQHLLWEAIVSMGLPLFSYLFFVSQDKSQTSSSRMKSLILIESSFNVLVLLTKISITHFGGAYNQTLNSLFILFFALQTYGFISTEKIYHHNYSSLRSWTLFTQICMQRWIMQTSAESNATANVIDPSGRFLVFGSDAPGNVMLHYGFWLLGVLYIDYEEVLPNSATQATHIASFLLACFSGEFWHARLLTASHLFVLDAILYFRTGITVSAAPLAVMPRGVLNRYKHALLLVNIISFSGCVACLLSTVVCGPYKLWCLGTNLEGPWNVI